LAEIVPVTSEALEAQVRSLLPSQRGFGEDLQASNVIVPILDLTPAALQTQTPEYLQQALAFGSQTAFAIVNTTTVIANTPGFWRLTYNSSHYGTGTTTIQLSDGLSTKVLYSILAATGANYQVPYDYTVFLAAGESITGISSNANVALVGSVRQVADVNGNLVYPSGYTPQ
jgi:hypothetical protein